MQTIHPQPLYLAAFAKEGGKAFPLLANKLIETQNDSNFRYIVYVLSEMQSRKTYDVVAEKDLMQYMEKRASEIQHEFWRGYTKKLVEKIQSYREGRGYGSTLPKTGWALPRYHGGLS